MRFLSLPRAYTHIRNNNTGYLHSRKLVTENRSAGGPQYLLGGGDWLIELFTRIFVGLVLLYVLLSLLKTLYGGPVPFV